MAKKTSVWGKTITGIAGKLQFPQIAKPGPNPFNKDLAYSCHVICAPSDKLTQLTDEITSVRELVFKNKEVHVPFEAGEDLVLRLMEAGKTVTDATEALYKGRTVLKLKAQDGKEAPKCYEGPNLLPRRPGNDADIQYIEEKFYAGAFVRIACTPFSYKMSASVQGVSLLFRAIQFAKDGERIGGVNLDAAFAEQFGDEGMWEEDEPFEADTEKQDADTIPF